LASRTSGCVVHLAQDRLDLAVVLLLSDRVL